jgi:hypothetical protein
MEFQQIRDRLAAAVGGEERLASNFSQRTMRDIKARAARELDDGANSVIEAMAAAAAALEREGLSEYAPEPELFIAGYVKRFAAYQAAGARTLNWMVTGPARFPVERNRKAMDSEHKRLGEMLEWSKGYPAVAVGQAKRRKALALGPDGVVNAELADLRKRLAKRELYQRQMKRTNEIIRREKFVEGDGEKLAEVLAAGGFPIGIAAAAALLRPAWKGAPIGYERYQLSNNNAEIKRLGIRIAEVERKLAAMEQAGDSQPAEREVNGVRIVENAGEDRLQLIFDGKPAPEIIAALKGRGFRWSPRAGAWQRQLTNAARSAAEGIVAKVPAEA